VSPQPEEAPAGDNPRTGKAEERVSPQPEEAPAGDSPRVPRQPPFSPQTENPCGKDGKDLS
ncbi:MAG: hypothetical protein LBD86_01190, partial [Spirochaetaceae bacterium]|nr:hypothetical protein [Spirochaetaceae bacterium]